MNQFYLFKCIGIYCNLCRESMILKLGYGRVSTNPTYTKNISKGHIDTCMLVDHNPGNWQCWPYIQLIQSFISEALLTCISTHIPLIHLFITRRSHTILACWPHSVQSRVVHRWQLYVQSKYVQSKWAASFILYGLFYLN